VKLFQISRGEAFSLFCGALIVSTAPVHAAEPATPDKTPGTVASLFGDKIVAKGKGVEIRSGQLEEAFLSLKANKSANGQDIPIDSEPEVERQLLERMIATQLFLGRATPADRTVGNEIAAKFMADTKRQSSSEEAFKRQLAALGLTVPQFERQVTDQAIVKAVIDRELKAQEAVSPADVKKFYEQNPKFFQQAEQVKVAQIQFNTRDLSAEQVDRKKAVAKKVLERANAGEDLSKLVKEFSEDEPSKPQNGEFTIARGQLPLEFESAAFSLKPNQISDLVRTQFGFHIIKLIEKIPAQTAELSKVQDRIRDTLLQEAVQKKLPAFVESLKKEADVQITLDR
jgi:peptidyl-prolyl cis-trans isomerase C